MRVTCTGCGVGLKLPPEFTGTKAVCPRCKTSIAIPRVPAASATQPVVAKPSPAPLPAKPLAARPLAPRPIAVRAPEPNDDEPALPRPKKKKRRSADSVPVQLWIALGLGLGLRLVGTLLDLAIPDEPEAPDPLAAGAHHTRNMAVPLIGTLVSILVWLGIYMQSNVCRILMQVFCILTMIVYVVGLIGAFALKEPGLIALVFVGMVIEVAVLVLLAQDSVKRYASN